MNLEAIKGGERIKVLVMIFIRFCLKMILKLIKKLCCKLIVLFWIRAVSDEMDSIMINKTWVLANLPPRSKELGV